MGRLLPNVTKRVKKKMQPCCDGALERCPHGANPKAMKPKRGPESPRGGRLDFSGAIMGIDME
jgi:hypothetical protein